MSVFLECESVDGPLFEKYGPRIAEDLSLPFDTPAEKEVVWRSLASLPSFQRAGEVPKMSRWFSWNAAAKKQLPEYNALRMVLEFHHPELQDPDSKTVKFNDIKGAAKESHHRKSLSLLHKEADTRFPCAAMQGTNLELRTPLSQGNFPPATTSRLLSPRLRVSTCGLPICRAAGERLSAREGRRTQALLLGHVSCFASLCENIIFCPQARLELVQQRSSIHKVPKTTLGGNCPNCELLVESVQALRYDCEDIVRLRSTSGFEN